MFLPFDCPNCDGTAFVYIQPVGLSSVHFGMGGAVAMQGTLADLGVDASRDEEGDIDVGVFQLQRLLESEQSVLGGAIRAS